MGKVTRFANLVAFTAILLASTIAGAEEHKARGIVLAVDQAHRSLTVSCEAIPGYMEPMEMSFDVRDRSDLSSLRPGSSIDFNMVEDGNTLYAENVRRSTAASHEPEPMEAGGLTVLHRALDPSDTAKLVPVGGSVPDFALTDQAGQRIHLAQFQGKVVALTFGYSRCPNPNYCFRMSNNLAQVERRLPGSRKKDLVLLTIMIDPDHDQGKVLSAYADTWKADPSTWHFLTGPVDEIHRIGAMFGMNFWLSEGLLTHPLHTVVIDRKGCLASNIEGNQFSAQQLAALVETVMNRPY
jgi:protein SCO1/2